MDKMQRIYKLHRLLSGRRTVVTLLQIQEELACSRATANRVIQEMRDEFHAPLVFDREYGGYRYAKGEGGQCDLPGVWFSEDELLAILTMERLLSHLDDGYLSRLLAPVRERVESTLGAADFNLQDRLRVVPHMQRGLRSDAFEPVVAGLIHGRRLRFAYHSRGRDVRGERVVSPQRLTHFRSNWYLDAWCHDREQLRRFSLDAMASVLLLDEAALRVRPEQVAAQMDGEYGAFAGVADKTAQLLFRADKARWVAHEHWHDRQRGQIMPDGRYALFIPYANAAELLMDILRYGDGVEVVEPAELRDAVVAVLQGALGQYGA